MIGEFDDATLVGNDHIKEAIHLFYREQTMESLLEVCRSMRDRIREEGLLIFPADISEDGKGNTVFSFKTLEHNGMTALVAFTDLQEQRKGPNSGAISQFIDCMLEPLMNMDEIHGLLLNPWGESLFLDKEDIAVILNSEME